MALLFKSRCLIKKVNFGLGANFRNDSKATPGHTLLSLAEGRPDDTEQSFLNISKDIFVDPNFRFNKKAYADGL